MAEVAVPAARRGSGSRARATWGSVLTSIKTATTSLGTNMGVNDLNLETIKNVTTNVASSINMDNITSNLQRVQDMASLGNLQDGIQASVAGIQSVSAASLDGIQASGSYLEGLSKTIMDNLAEKRKTLTNVEALKAKGNFQLVDTITNIEYQLLLILFYFCLAFFVNWFLITGVTQTVSIVKNAAEFVDDPNLERKIQKMKDSIQNDIKKFSDLNQLKEGMTGIAAGIKSKAQVIRENIALDKFNILGEKDDQGN